jgi:hypothetical protein
VLTTRIFQILVTHHVELVLPGAYYLVRMLDGRIDSQGTIKDLRAQGVLDDITHDAAVEMYKEEVKGEVPSVEEEEEKKATDAKKPRKLIKDEHRETGGVKWLIYKSYLKASYVSCVFAGWAFFGLSDFGCLGRIGSGAFLRFWWLWYRCWVSLRKFGSW